MSETQTLFGRLGNLFRRNPRDHELPLEHTTLIDRPPQHGGGGSFLRPWSGQRAGMQKLQDGFNTLTDLMGTIRENLEVTSRRQGDLMQHLASLPEALRTLPEASRIHGETLKAIHQQLEQQTIQQEKLGDILEKLNSGGSEQREALGEIRERVEVMRQTDQAISQNLNGLGAALQSVSHNSTTGAQVLEQMRDRLDTRDVQLERILHRQGTRFTTMLAIAIFLSTSAVVAVCVMGYLLMIRK